MKNMFKTANNNHYLYHSTENKTLYLHPLIRFFADMENRGTNAGEWIAGLDNQESPGVDIKSPGKFTAEEIRYYFKKYNLLKEKQYFNPVKEEGLYQRKLTEHDIDNLLTGCTDVIFEITRACNLHCRYCFQGDLYSVYKADQKKHIDPGKAKLLLNYLRRYWNRPLAPKRIGIKFFGGEPLINFDAVKEIVEYAKTLTPYSERFYYSITTNGVLLDRHLDYLVANNIYISISLDGDKGNNSHRVSSNGTPSFEKITANIDRIRDTHPSYFETHVSFQSVLHNHNSITDIHNYFRKTYQKRPLMMGLTRVGVNQARKEDFDTLQVSAYQNLYHGRDYPLLKEKKLEDLPQTPGSGIITHNIYDWLLKDLREPGKTEKDRTPTGTCHPFSRGIFLSTEGKILPCERIDQKFALGHIDNEVELDFKAIAERVNRYFANMTRLCLSCAHARFCKKCMFYCKVEEARPVCNQFCTQEDFLQELSDNIGYIEDKPEIYYKHITEI